MDVSDLRQRILRALEAARAAPDSRRSEIDAAGAAYARFLDEVAVPLLRQAQSILKAEGHLFTVHAPVGGAKLVSDAHPETYLELVLDTAGIRPQLVSRISVARGRKGVTVEERAIASGKAIQALRDEDLAAFLVATIPQLVRQ
jgi:hypothetical protein